MSIGCELLNNVLVAAQCAGMDQARLAHAAGLAPETISRAKRRGSLDLRTLEALAKAAGLRIELAAIEPLPGAGVKSAPMKSPLADPKWGLAWSNSAISTETLIRSALLKGGFAVLLVAVKAHGLSEVLKQWEAVKSTLKAGAQAEVERKLQNIKEGMASAKT